MSLQRALSSLWNVFSLSKKGLNLKCSEEHFINTVHSIDAVPYFVHRLSQFQTIWTWIYGGIAQQTPKWYDYYSNNLKLF